MGNCIRKSDTQCYNTTPSNSLSLKFEVDSKKMRKTLKNPTSEDERKIYICTYPGCKHYCK